MSTQAYYKERLGFDPADTVAEHQREQRSQHGYEESLTKFKGQNDNSTMTNDATTVDDNIMNNIDIKTRTSSSFGYWGCWAKFIESHGKFHTWWMLNE